VAFCAYHWVSIIRNLGISVMMNRLVGTLAQGFGHRKMKWVLLGLGSMLGLTTIAAPGWSQSVDLSQRYVAILTAGSVVPNMPMTEARAAGGAVLVGDRLIVRGDFSNLSSAFRDYATDPVNPPNPKITSGVHVHLGEPGKNGPFQYALTVMPNADGMGGRFMGEYVLSGEQMQALKAGNLYLDLHTKLNRSGELRGVLRAL
jgi:hypothetical protein